MVSMFRFFTVVLVISLPVFSLSPEEKAEMIPEDHYVTAKGGDLYCKGKRVRFWGSIGAVPADKASGEDIYAHNRRMVDRLAEYGFNMARIWKIRSWDYKMGDGSKMDVYDKFLALMYEKGFKIWGTNNYGNAHVNDVDIIDDASTADNWQKAVKEIASEDRDWIRVMPCEAVVWDPRLEAIAIRNYKKRLNHVNQHTGLRRADDPMFAVWELTNEHWWIVRMVSGKWQKLPAFFKRQLIAKWHDFLEEKYGTEEKLRKAWVGLLEGEELAKETILFAPMRGENTAAVLNDANPLANAKVEGISAKYGRDHFNYQRGADVNEFLTEMLLSHKRRLATMFKSLGRGTKRVPLLWDTGIGYNGICQLMHQNADAVAHCAYVAGWTHDTTHKRYPWYSGLEEPPRICQNVPWLEHNTVDDKPYFVYETQIGAPSKYRAEFPYRMLFLASIQDWDAICWHTQSGLKWENENVFEGPLAFPGKAAYQFVYRYDEVQLSAMHAAAKMFTNMHLEPAANPTTFVYGKKTLYDPASMSYAGSYGENGEDMLNTAYRYGSRIWIDPTRDRDTIIGPVLPLKGFAYPSPLKPTHQMTYDWNLGNLQFDSPGCVAFTGFLGQYGSNEIVFDNGVTISDVTVVNPPDTPYPVSEEEKYVAIGLTSTDRRPLRTCKKAILSAVSTSANSGLKVGRDPDGPVRPRHAWDGMKVLKKGSTPVLVSRVGCRITAPALAGMRYTLRDWNWKVIGKGKIGRNGRLTVNPHDEVFMVELER